jgi:hypothetical protein
MQGEMFACVYESPWRAELGKGGRFRPGTRAPSPCATMIHAWSVESEKSTLRVSLPCCYESVFVKAED